MLVFALGGLIWVFFISPAMVPVKANVQSFPGFSTSEVLAAAGIHNRSTFISINAYEAERLLSQHYMVESAKVVKHFPDRVSVYLEPRKAVAVSFARVNSRTQPVYIDRHGVVCGIGGGEGASPWLPVISGVFGDSDQPWLGMQVSAPFLPLFSRISAISDEDSNIWRAISEIGITKKENDLYDLVLYPVRDSIRLKVGNDITKDSIYYALLMFDVSRQFGDAVPAEIDVRSGIGVFNNQGGYLGE